MHPFMSKEMWIFMSTQLKSSFFNFTTPFVSMSIKWARKANFQSWTTKLAASASWSLKTFLSQLNPPAPVLLLKDITIRNCAFPNLIVRKRESQRPRQASKSKPPGLHSPSLHDRCLNQFSMSQFESSQCQTLLREFLARLCAEQWY